jgi:hypothetical protein
MGGSGVQPVEVRALVRCWCVAEKQGAVRDQSVFVKIVLLVAMTHLDYTHPTRKAGSGRGHSTAGWCT